jgi:uroporphyrinogen-III synthase
VPERFVGEGLVEAFPVAPPGGGRVLVAQAEGARDVVAAGLATLGWDVTSVVAYRSVVAAVAPAAIERARHADAIAFTSASTVERFVAAAGIDVVPPVVACIGPVTADAAKALGVPVTVVATPHTIDGLVAALVRYFATVDGAHA